MTRNTLRSEVVQFKGGLDLVSPALSMPPGALIDAVNFESDPHGGYRRMAGFERYDGRPSPSAAEYWGLPCAISASVAAGASVVGMSSGATGVVLGSTAVSLIITRLTGNFVAGENLWSVDGVKAVATAAQITSSAASLADHSAYRALAANEYRGSILPVPGTGPIRGVWNYNGEDYAFRDSGALCLMYKATTSGWALQTFGYEIPFVAKAGAPGTAIAEGNTIVGATSGATAAVRRVLLRTGQWNSSPVGTLVIDSVTGTFVTGEALNVGGTGLCQTSAPASAITLLAGGRFEFVNYNFGGGVSTQRMYFCDGVNRAHEWDGSLLVPIPTGASIDAPQHIAAWQNMLCLGIRSSVTLSGVGAPYSYTALTGAAEIALGDLCTGLLPQPGTTTTGALVVFCAGSTRVLYGTSTADLNLVLHSADAGAYHFTAQNIGSAYYLDTKGVVNLATTQNYGNFASATITKQIQPLIDRQRGKAVASCIVRSSNQYRVFFNDGTGLIVRPNTDTSAEVMYFDHGLDRYMNVVCSFVEPDGAERILAGGSDGYVYELDKGTSFDGANIRAWAFLAFNSSKTPRIRKRYRRAVVQATCVSTAKLRIGYELDFGSDSTTPGIQSNREVMYGAGWVTPGVLSDKSLVGYGGYWDVLTWDDFIWDSPYVSEYTVDTPGNGANIGLMFYNDSAADDPFSMSSCVMHYFIGRESR